MSTHGSRKRRHKSREKMQTASTNSDDNQDNNQPQPQEQPKDEQGEAGGRQELVAILDRLFSKSMEDGAPAADSNDRLSRVACLSVAASIGHVEGVKKLLDENLDVNARSKGCFTVLQSAVSWKHYKIAEMLLQKGAEVSDISEDGNTALHLSAQSSNKEAVSFLLHRGALGDVKNNLGQTVLHKAAKLGDLETCELFIQHFSSGDTSGCEQVAKLILSEDTEGRTPICEALKNQHQLLVQLLLNACRPEDALEFYMRRIHKLGSLSSDDPSFDMQSILGSLLLVVKSLQKEFLSQLATADPIHHLVQTIRLHVTSPRVLSAACLMISQLIWKEDPGTDEAISQQEETLDLRDDLLQRFLHCKGPDVVMEKLSTHVLTAHDTYIVVSTLLPIMILASRSAGRTWLGQNSGNLSFYKELLTRNKTFITHINISNHMGQGLQVSQVIKTFLGFVESIEAKDREQNLAELLEEEERDRIKREKKKRKRQKRHKQSKLDVTQTSTAEGSTDDENGEQGAWNADGLCNADLFSPGEAGSDKDHALYYQQKVNDQTEQKANDASQEKFGLQSQVLREKECTRKAFPLEAIRGQGQR
ncbi:uncharacterized protein LOC131951852 [Physella acuta]|uniref:uncharacterized protein LOC131951852 n=1 Tax=Physella acuta TaxID=109671 RepID=UPI0027DCA60A|nr:uncharacterized protein LOC131951852 [Physella acuta]